LHSKSQYTTVKHNRQLSEHTYTSNPHGLGTLSPIEFFQQHLLWQSSNTHSNSCSQKASKHKSGQSIVRLSVLLHTTTAPRHIINLPFTSPDDRMSSLERFSNPTEPMSVGSSKTPNPIFMEMPVYCCQHNTAACLHCYPPITLGYQVLLRI
jgi:hypothetical protein